MICGVAIKKIYVGAAALTSMVLAGCGQVADEGKLPDLTTGLTSTEWSHAAVFELVDVARESDGFVERLTVSPERLSPNDLTLTGFALFYGLGVPQLENEGGERIALACVQGQMRACANRGARLNHEDNQETAAESIALLERACNAKISWGCVQLAMAYAKGRGVEADKKTAIAYAKRACADNRFRTCATAGVRVQEASVPIAREMLEMACTDGNAFACHGMGQSYGTGEFAPPDYIVAGPYFEKGCDLNLIDSCDSTVGYWQSGYAPVRRPKRALKYVIQGCREYDRKSCLRLVNLYRYPAKSGVSVDLQKSFEFGLLGCESGDSDMCRWTAEAYEKGEGTDPDPKKALSIYKRECRSGQTYACKRAAVLEQNDTHDAFEIAKRACSLGDGGSCRKLAWDYANSQSDAGNIHIASELFMLGCRNGDAQSCLDRGSLYEWALNGMPADKIEARKMYARACEMDFVYGCDALEQINAEAG